MKQYPTNLTENQWQVIKNIVEPQEQFKANAIEQLKAGVPLSGRDGVLAPLLENLLNSALEGEIVLHTFNVSIYNDYSAN